MTTPEEYEEYFEQHPDVRDERRKHLDAPELSRFLPEGWRWEHNEEWYVIFKNTTILVLLDVDHIDDWHGYGLLHPSEGGGFQRHAPGDPMPCDAQTQVDVIICCGEIDYNQNPFKIWDKCDSHDVEVTAWRPHLAKGGEA